MEKINFGNSEFILCPSGALFWPSKNILIVSDLHFEKASSFAAFKTFLPPQDTDMTLKKLLNDCEFYEPDIILFLGDVFHDKNALSRFQENNLQAFNRIFNDYEVIWVEGNHDPDSAPDCVINYESYVIKEIIFNHISLKTDQFEISGHYHPCVSFSHKEQNIRRPCFVISSHKIILPSYGVLTGGLNINQPIYKEVLNSEYDVYALGKNSVIKINKNKIRKSKL